MKSVPPWHRSPVAIGMAAVGIALTMVVHGTLAEWERRAREEAAARLVQEKVGTLRITLLRSMEVLHSMAGLHAADEHEQISRHQFAKFVHAALRRQPELLALSWNPVVTAQTRARIEAEARADGSPAFAFRELNAAGELVPAGPRPNYVPVRFIEPLERNIAALGYDLNSDPGRRDSVEKARDSGEPVATAPLRLAQDNAPQSGVLVVQPVYRHPDPDTLDARRNSIAGYAVAVFRASDLFAGAFQSLTDQGIDVWLRDETPGSAAAVLPGSADGMPPPDSQSAAPVRLLIAGRTLAAHYAANARFLSKPARHQSTLILLGGLLLTGLGTAYLHTTRRRAIEVAAANAALHDEVLVRQQAESRAANANQAKSDFLASMSHEIRTPLNAMLGYAQLLQRDASLSPDQRDCVGGISVSGGHLLGLINEILDLSKIEAGRMERNEVDFDLPALASSLETTFKPLCARQRLGFRVLVDSAGRTGCRVRGDEGKIRQILINLLGNAIKFTAAGEVVLQCRPEGREHWRFDVTDTGQGIPPEEHANIFNPFHQGSVHRQRGGGGTAGDAGAGTGLGLTIAQRQVALLGGTLCLESERGRGSRFHFSIPLPEAPPATPSIRRQPAFLSPGSVVRALVVDDGWENRDVLIRLLGAVGCEAVGAGTAAEAAARADEFRPTIAFVDWLMPSAPGHSLVRTLLENPAHSHLPILAHSASPLQRHRDEALAAGCVDFLPKPIRSEQLYECLVRHLGVTFDYLDTPGDGPTASGLPAGFQMALPEELHARLAVAAELHSTTALKGCLVQLRLLGPEGGQLADQIRHLMRSYDMDGIQRLLAGAVAPARSGPPAVPVYGSDDDKRGSGGATKRCSAG